MCVCGRVFHDGPVPCALYIGKAILDVGRYAPVRIATWSHHDSMMRGGVQHSCHGVHGDMHSPFWIMCVLLRERLQATLDSYIRVETHRLAKGSYQVRPTVFSVDRAESQWRHCPVITLEIYDWNARW